MAATLGRPIKVGVIAEQTGPLSFMGIADANVAKMVIDDINAAGGLLGQQIELHRRGQRDHRQRGGGLRHQARPGRQVDVIFGGIFSSTRQAIKGRGGRGGQDALHLPRAVRGTGVRPADLLHRPGAGAAGRPAHPVADGADGREEVRPAVGRLHLAAHHERQGPPDRRRPSGGEIVEEDYYPLDHSDYGEAVEKIMSSGAEVVFNTIVPPGVVPFFEQLHDAGFTKRGGHLVCTYFDETCLNLVPAEQVEGLYSCLDYYQDVDDPFSKELLARYNERFPGSAMFTAGGACSGMYRGLRLWEAAVREAGSLDQDAVVARTGPREDRRRARRPGGDGARSAPRSDEHVHRPGERGRHQDRQEPGGRRPRRAHGGSAASRRGMSMSG